MKALAVFFSILILLLSVRPRLPEASEENTASCCQQADCDSPSSGNQDSEEAPDMCNPFQCHVCCFVHLQKLSEFRWSVAPVLSIAHYTPLQVSFSAGIVSAWWQPPQAA